MNKLFLLCLILCSCSCFFCASASEEKPNVRVIPGVELCGQMCDKLVALDVKHGDVDCSPYYTDITVDDKVMNCKEFCEFEMSNSVDFRPQCVIDNVEVCSVDMSAKCGL